jgi:hypothetical protein
MGLLDGFEKLINEHGSASILKERISLANDKYSLLEEKNTFLKQENEMLKKEKEILKSENQTLNLNLQQAEQKIRQLEEQILKIHASNPYGYVCDHCASHSLTRTGSRPDPTFGGLGVKQKIFVCDSCGKESAFTPKNNEI